jgi:hypothetical protein
MDGAGCASAAVDAKAIPENKADNRPKRPFITDSPRHGLPVLPWVVDRAASRMPGMSGLGATD